MRAFTLAAVCVLAGAHVRAEDLWDFRASVSAEVASAYRSSSSGLLDTRPVATQTLNWHLSLGDYGFLEGYVWAISAFHNMQRKNHRVLFYDTEGAVRYVSFDPSVADTFYVKTNDVPIEGREPNVQMSTTYGDYLHVDEHANPRYWQSAHSFAAEPMGFVHYYILRISWEEGENNRETDIICFAARVKFYE